MKCATTLLILFISTAALASISQDCDVMREQQIKIAALAANLSGETNVPNDYAAFNSAAVKLRIFGNQKLCGSRAIDHGRSVWLRYTDKQAGAKEDIFNFDENNHVVSWMRLDSNNKSRLVDFHADGRIALAQ